MPTDTNVVERHMTVGFRRSAKILKRKIFSDSVVYNTCVFKAVPVRERFNSIGILSVSFEDVLVDEVLSRYEAYVWF